MKLQLFFAVVILMTEVSRFTANGAPTTNGTLQSFQCDHPKNHPELGDVDDLDKAQPSYASYNHLDLVRVGNGPNAKYYRCFLGNWVSDINLLNQLVNLILNNFFIFITDALCSIRIDTVFKTIYHYYFVS